MTGPRRATVAVALAVVLVLVGACSKGGKPAPSAPTRAATSTTARIARPAGFVALGDSYTAGGGAAPYDLNPSCAASSKGYPSALAAADADVKLVQVRACGGAKTDQMLTGTGPQSPAQIPTTPDDTVGLVAFTIGGADTGLAAVIAACATLDCSNVDHSPAAQAKLSALTETLVGKVYPALRRAYPKARLVHVGYPELTSTKLGQTCPWLAPDEETTPNALIDAVDGAIRDAAAQSGQVEYVDVSHVFAGHELCTDDPWVHDLSEGPEALHPTVPGYAALGHAIAAHLAA